MGVVPLHNLNRNDEYKALGRPLKQVIPFVDLWKQGKLVKPVELHDNLRTEEFYLGDFGLAMRVGDPITQRGFPLSSFRSPDRLASSIEYFRPDVDQAERELVYSIMKKVLVYCPEERLTATQLLQDPSFKALMERYGC